MGGKVAWQLVTERKRSKKVDESESESIKATLRNQDLKKEREKDVNRRRKNFVQIQDLIVFKNDDWFPNEEGKKKVREESK